VRPKFDPPPAPQEADPVEVARAAIFAESDVAKLHAMRARIDQRLKEGKFKPYEADELLDTIQSRVEFIEQEGEVTV
jgi:Cdc6-like AAA superfamily ATPase